MRLHNLFSATLIACTLATPGWAGESITVVSWGGAYADAQRRAIFEPFTTATGIGVKTVSYSGGVDAVRERATAEGWDVIDMIEDQAITACQQDLLKKIDANQVASDHLSTPLAKDFVADAFRPCSVAQNVYATVFAYDDRAFLGEKPDAVADFFDIERFPGKRALKRDPDVILEWALMAEGVPIDQIYDLLSTDRGLRLAFRKLETLRESIIWWQAVNEPAQMLGDGRAVFASGYNGRFFSATQKNEAALTIVWDGHVVSYDVWAISRESKNHRIAEQFIRFATAPQQMAALAESIPYGPTRRSALSRIGLHRDSAIPMRDHLPNAPRHFARALVGDTVWYARTRALRLRRFDDWLKGLSD